MPRNNGGRDVIEKNHNGIIIGRSPGTPLAEDGTRGRRPTRPPIPLSAYSCNREEKSLVSTGCCFVNIGRSLTSG